MKILRLTAENVKRLSVVEIEPHGAPVVVIAGENEAGKSSVLDAIAYAIGGKDLVPAKPIRDGQARAEIVVDLGEYIVTRTFTRAGGGSLTVTNRDGAKYPSPQALLDGLVGKLTFDPLAFAESDDKAQADTLRRLAGLETSDLDAERKRLFDERTVLNRQATQIQGAVGQAIHHMDVGVELQTTEAIVKQLEAADTVAETATAMATEATHALSARTLAAARAQAASAAVDRAREALADAEAASVDADEALRLAEETARAKGLAAETAATIVPNRAALRQQLAAIETANGKIRENQHRRSLQAQLAAKKAECDELTAQIATLDMQKAERLSAATFPVPGLGLDDCGVTWNGLPFAQASTAVRVRASVAIGLALNPKLKVLLVRNGNDLGTKNLSLLAEMAESAGAQIWIERIAGGNGQTTIVIDEGAVVARQAVSA